ncbi:MAG: IS982 family transposase [Solirubrobacteraceae bacterium]
MHANLDALLTALYVRVDDLLPKRSGPGRPPRISDAELIALAVAQMFLGIPNDRQFLALAAYRLGHLFRYLPKQPGYNKRLRALAPTIARVITQLVVSSPSFCDGLRLLDSTPVPCGQSRETARRSELSGYAAYGYCTSHSRYFWGFRLYLLCASDGMPIAFELAPANTPERVVATEMLERVDLEGYTVLADKGFAGEEFEAQIAGLGARFLRPDRKDEPRRNGSLGPVRQWIESTIWTCKGQLTLERHGGRTLPGLCARIALRLLALTAGLIHNQTIGQPGRHFAAYTH